jgi:hypothetical protein
MMKMSSDSEKALQRLKVKKTTLKIKASEGILEVGRFIEGKMAEKISLNQLSPALQDSTIKAKGSSKPLFDDGHLLQQIDSRVSADGLVEVGVFDGPEKRAFIAMIHEYGAPAANIPERSFMRSAVEENRKGFKKAFKDGWDEV